ncbi:MAG: hypothetical protein QG578_1395, partial [Thermodesulfobacteriota bacterium]|nr:hypothetical protein [Thermodesulfobacteriota bacterium]
MISSIVKAIESKKLCTSDYYLLTDGLNPMKNYHPVFV